MKNYANVNEAYLGISRELLHAKKVPTRLGESKEIHPFYFQISDFRNYMLSSKERVINFPMALAELIWIMNGSSDYWITKYNRQLKEYADTDERSGKKYFNAAYGSRMRSSFGLDQLADVIETLTKDRNSRQAAIVYRHPWYDRFPVKVKDKACNVISLFLIRDNMLDITHTVRSQDFIWGLPYNFFQFGFITQYIAEQVKSVVGSYNETVNSIHVYEKHYDDLNEIASAKGVSLEPPTLPHIGNVDFKQIRSIMIDMESSFTINEIDRINRMTFVHIDSVFMYNLLKVIQAYWLMRSKKYDLVRAKVLDIPNPFFRRMARRYFETYYKDYRSD